MIEDFFPSILAMAGVKEYKTIQKVDGKSFIPILKNPGYLDTNRVLIWHMPNKWIAKDGPGINYYSAVRQGNWKMVYNMRTGTKALYNLHADIGENNDLASHYPEKVNSLSAILSGQLREWNSPMPKYKNTGKSVPLPDEGK
jgi:arylsulfatase A-like enzyme